MSDKLKDELLKDRLDDWKRIQNADRECDKLKAEIEDLKKQISFTNSNWPHEKKAIEAMNQWQAQCEKLADEIERLDDLGNKVLSDFVKFKEQMK